MRKLKLLLTMLILLVGGVSSANADPVGVAVQTGTYYLYNIGAQKYLTVGQVWGCRAALSSGEAIPIELTDGGSGNFKFITKVAGDATGMKIDSGSPFLDGSGDAILAMTFDKQGDTNIYKIHSGDNYLKYDGADANFGAADASGDNDKWIVTTEDNMKADLITRMGTATNANPVNVTLFVKSARPAWGTSRFWPYTNWTNGNSENADDRHSGGSAAVMGYWGESGKDIYQEITVPKGKYKVRCLGYARAGDWSNNYCWEHKDGQNSEVYISSGNNSDSHVLPSIFEGAQTSALGAEDKQSKYSLDGGVDKYIPNAPLAAAIYFSNQKYTTWAEATTTVNGTVRIGVRNPSSQWEWVEVSQFELLYLEPVVSVNAINLPVNGVIVADQWYKYSVASTGTYNIAAGTAANIILTTNGDQLVSAATGSAITTGDAVNLTEGDVLYYKSTTANTLTIEANTKTYTVGDVTATSITGTPYLQSMPTTVTFTLGNAETNDGTAALAIQGTPVAKLNDGSSDVADGALSIDNNVVTATFTSVTLDPAKTYTITLPANAVAWDKNTENKNTAKVITFNTPAVFDGVYYMYNTDTKNYISRAGNYNTQAIMDNYGLAFNVSTDTENNTKLQYFDSELWLGDDGFCYGDCTNDRIRTYNITKVAEGYKFLNTNNSKYLAVYDGQTVGDAVEGGNLQGTSNVWNLENTAAHVANYTTNANKQATDVATAASLAGITTKAALDTELEANYIAIPVTVTGAKAEKYQVYPGNNMDSGPVAYHSETVNLTPGLYKLSVDAFQRATTNEKVFAADGARGLICLYAGAVKTQIKSVSEYGSNSQYANTDYADNGKYYPNREATGYQALETGNYKNEVYFYVAETSDVEIGIQNASRPGNNCATWSIYDNWTLTRYISASTTESVTVTDAGYATYVSTLPLNYTSTDIKAYTAKATAGKVVLTQINKVPANTPVVLYKEGGATEDIPVAASTDTPAASDLVAGTGAAVATAEGDYTNYILNVGTKGIGFYRANSQTVEANRAYMHVSNSETGSMSRMAIVFDNQTTGIANLKAAADGDDAIYNLNGQRIEKATKGVYIIDGKKMIRK